MVNISSLAESFAKALNYSPGDLLDPIVTRLHGNIVYLPLSAKESKQASITVEEGGEFVIRLFSPLFPLQERMSIAHELGHLFLHSRLGEIAIEASHDDNNENRLAENQAQRFARAFLMPSVKVQEMLAAGSDSLGIAAAFMVPEPVARQRIAEISG